MPTPGGWISQIFCYYETDLAASSATFVVLWNAGTVYATLNPGTVNIGAHAAGGQAWQGGTLATPVYVEGGTAISIGAWCPQSVGIVFSSEAGGSSSSNTQASGPGSQAGSGATGIGALGAYGVYAPNLKSIRNASNTAWLEKPEMIRNSSGVWVPKTPQYVRNDSNTAGLLVQ